MLFAKRVCPAGNIAEAAEPEPRRSRSPRSKIRTLGGLLHDSGPSLQVTPTSPHHKLLSSYLGNIMSGPQSPNATKSRPVSAIRGSKEKQPQSQQAPPLPVTQPRKEQLVTAPTAPPTDPKQPIQAHYQQTKKIARRSSKPILDWFQRKLGGSVRARRASDVARGRAPNGESGAFGREKRRPSFPEGFRELSRVQSTPSRGRSSADRDLRRFSQAVDSFSPSRHVQRSFSDDDRESREGSEGRGEASTYRSSLARESMWSPTSNFEADEDASVRPLPPSSPPSPSPSRSSSSYLSNPRTFKSMAASTKPTTLLSVDITNGMAHIAQAPPTPNLMQRLPAHLWPSGGGSGGGSISFSALPPSPSSSRSPSVQNSYNAPYSNAPHGSQPVQAPQHTTHHPRNNPRPSSPPLDNASILTLASSAFGIPGARIGVVGGGDGTSVSHLSQFGGSRVLPEDRSSHFVLGDELDVEGERDFDASVRALRPRSSRRGSWESEASGWSARVGNGSTLVLAGTPAPRDKSFWPASVRTGQTSVDNEDDEDDEGRERSYYYADGHSKHDASPVSASQPAVSHASTIPSSPTVAPDDGVDVSEKTYEPDATPRHEPGELDPQTEPPVVTPTKADKEVLPLESGAKTPHTLDDDARSLTPSEAQPDIWHSAPSTPMF
ncbi:hypothetical protein BV25DRAFT_72286 [Artomyces pyxidatus]|uniref:Uncharacterized protein n=1 Tax=Artomyces pyxidatus TaxID=48021 RepID=A0ACB8TKR1_9AGAM|nr:hypothetical protein BV25DRAFT_72286 [Artomyces pyxidatus]